MDAIGAWQLLGDTDENVPAHPFVRARGGVELGRHAHVIVFEVRLAVVGHRAATSSLLAQR
jgi:hypothetical protein